VNGLGAASIIGIGATVINSVTRQTGRWREVATIADAVHLASAGRWIGGLVVLVLRARRERLLDEPARSFVRWFSQVALWSVGGTPPFREPCRVCGRATTRWAISCRARMDAFCWPRPWSSSPLVAMANQSRQMVAAGRASRDAAASCMPFATNWRVSPSSSLSPAGLSGCDATAGQRVVGPGRDPRGLSVTSSSRSASNRPASAQTELHLTLYKVGSFSTVQAPVDEVRAELRESDKGVGPLTVNLLRAGPAHFNQQRSDHPDSRKMGI